jgi:hypothetical protein
MSSSIALPTRLGGAFFMGMHMNQFNNKAIQISKFFVDANFYISVLVLVYGGITAITENYSVFAFNEDLFGAMHNNLRIALLYLGMTEMVVFIFCFVTNQPRLMIFVGYFLIMMLGSLTFYGKINSVPIDNNILLFFLYTGISHIAFGLMSAFGKQNSSRFIQ